MLKIQDLSVNYGQVSALNSVTAEVRNNEIVCLLGSNGAGKSTFMRAIIGLVLVSGGSVVFDGVPIHQLPAEARAKLGIASVPEGRGMLARMSVRENLLMGGYVRGGQKELKEDIERVLSLFPILRARLKQLAGTLSGGEQQMLAIGRALMLQPRLILMDEPSMGLAPVIVEQVFSIIEQINQRNTTVLLVEQNAQMALSVAHRETNMQTAESVLQGKADKGKLTYQDEKKETRVITGKELEEAFLGG
jgi:branched-chain amino acid transport system ATP-binding protein